MDEPSSPSLTVYLSLTSSPSSPRLPLTLPAGCSAADLRRLAAAASCIPLSTLKLIFRGRLLPDTNGGDVVSEFQLENDCVIHVMGKPTPTNATPTTSTRLASVTLDATASLQSSLSVALASLKASHSLPVYRTALATADKLLQNILRHPMEEKYRRIPLANPAFQRRLGGLVEGNDLLLSAGFVRETDENHSEVYLLRPSAEAWPRLVAAGQAVQRALEEVNRLGEEVSVTQEMGDSVRASVPGEAAMQNMLRNPQMLQNMLSNPMVQQMMQSDPRLANNSMLQQSIEALSSNPDMIRQFSQMMADPGVRSNVSQMMQQAQGEGTSASGGRDLFRNGPEEMVRQMEQFQRMSQQYGGVSGEFHSGASNSGSGTPSGQNHASGNAGGVRNANSLRGAGGSAAEDTQMTEEEMIAEAIERSLRES